MNEHVQGSPFAHALGASLKRRVIVGEKSPFARALNVSLQERAAAAALPQGSLPPLVVAGEVGAKKGVAAGLRRIFAQLKPGLLSLTWVAAQIEARRQSQRERRLRVIESVPLGEKRFVAIVSVQAAQFLIGHGPGGVSLLARLEADGASVSESTKTGSPPSIAQEVREAW